MGETVIRFVVGGAVVSVFAFISDLFKPKSFAGLFGAAPSVALASLTITVIVSTKHFAAIEGRSMILGAAALLIYTWTNCVVMFRLKTSVATVALTGLLLWALVATGLWYVILC